MRNSLGTKKSLKLKLKPKLYKEKTMATRAGKKINQMTRNEAQAEHTKLMGAGHFKMERTKQLAIRLKRAN